MRFYRDKLGVVKRAELGDAVRVTKWRGRRLNQQLSGSGVECTGDMVEGAED